jgi:uncharacterized protein with WD repeat
MSIAVFNADGGGKPARITLYSYNIKDNLVSSPVATRSTVSASDATILWNNSGSTLLIHTSSDTSLVSYYGATALFIMSSDGNISNQVDQSKQGSIYDVKWSPLGTIYQSINLSINISIYQSMMLNGLLYQSIYQSNTNI